MPITRMYTGVNNSVPTTLAVGVEATTTEFTVVSAAPLPSAPNILTVSTGASAELVYYAGRSGNRLTGCVRGYNSTTAQAWPVGTIVYRAYTAADHQLFVSNINTLSREKLDIAGGNASATIVNYEEPAERTEPESGGTMAEIVGRVVKWVRGLTAGDVGAVKLADDGFADAVQISGG